MFEILYNFAKVNFYFTPFNFHPNFISFKYITLNVELNCNINLSLVPVSFNGQNQSKHYILHLPWQLSSILRLDCTPSYSVALSSSPFVLDLFFSQVSSSPLISALSLFYYLKGNIIVSSPSAFCIGHAPCTWLILSTSLPCPYSNLSPLSIWVLPPPPKTTSLPR